MRWGARPARSPGVGEAGTGSGSRRFAGTVLGAVIAVGALSVMAASAAAQGADALAQTPAVRDFFGISPRRVVWVVAQLHLLFAAFVVGVPWFAVIVEVIGWRTGEERYDRLAHEFTRLLAAAFATTAALGGLLTFVLFGLYPRFSNYFFGIFAPAFYVYGAFFLLETAAVYLYYNTWDRLQDRKGLHVALGFFLLISGTLIVFMGSAWSSYMMSPSGVDESGVFTGSTWDAIANPLWIPVVVHRLLGNFTFGGFVVGAYAAVRYLSARSDGDRAHYDWMGYVGNFIGIMGLIPLPFAGYYLGREVYSWSPVMGNNMMGGDFSWAFIIQAMLLGLIFILGNYYLWSGMARIPGAERYQRFIKYYIWILVACVAIWLTPRNLPLSPEEQLALGSQVHPVLGYFGLMSTKNAVINLVILTTFLSFLLYRRANKTRPVPVSEQGPGSKAVVLGAGAISLVLLGWYAHRLFTLDPATLQLAPERAVWFQLPAWLLVAAMAGVLGALVLTFRDRGKLAQAVYLGYVAVAGAVVLGVYGFFVMSRANPFLRQLAVTQWLLLMSALILVVGIDIVLFRGAHTVGDIRWGEVTRRSQYALIALCVLIIMTMGMMAYVRSGLRENWHIYGVMEDTSAWAFTPSIATMTQMVGGITIVFLAAIAFLFWLSGLMGSTHSEEGVAP